jgi:RHS repeat-associated protein
VGSHTPYGQLRGQAMEDTSFATYRQNGPGLHYAMQRYYWSGLGRFLTPDPSDASAVLGEPHSWNRYAYVLGDPVNRTDPSGLTPIPRYECEWIETTNGMENRCYILPYPGGGPLPEPFRPPLDPDQRPNGGLGEVGLMPIGFPGAYQALQKPDCYRFFGFNSATDA